MVGVPDNVSVGLCAVVRAEMERLAHDRHPQQPVGDGSACSGACCRSPFGSLEIAKRRAGENHRGAVRRRGS